MLVDLVKRAKALSDKRQVRKVASVLAKKIAPFKQVTLKTSEPRFTLAEAALVFSKGAELLNKNVKEATDVSSVVPGSADIARWSPQTLEAVSAMIADVRKQPGDSK